MWRTAGYLPPAREKALPGQGAIELLLDQAPHFAPTRTKQHLSFSKTRSRFPTGLRPAERDSDGGVGARSVLWYLPPSAVSTTRCDAPRVRRWRQELTSDELSYKMLYMKKTSSISIRELQQNLKRVMARVARGQVFEVTRHRRPIARLAPMRSVRPVNPWPDLEARARAVFGNRLVTPGASQIISEDRGER